MPEDINKHYLYPAALFTSPEPHLVTTVLGSCVAVCLWDKYLQVGGINHYMLPLWNGKGLASPKYGNIAIEKLIAKIEEMGSNRRNLIAKVFGGGEVIQSNISQFHIGERNAQIALDMLKEAGISIQGSSLGGKLGRKIIYHTGTGAVKHKFIERTIAEDIVKRGRR